MPHPLDGHLAVILATPPLTTSGERTLARVRMASELMGVSRVSICNLLDVATNDVREVATVGNSAAPWLASRPAILEALGDADDVLLAWGSEPTGPARNHQREQVAWVMNLIASQRTEAWAVGAQPRHPSRWQRYTSRAHAGMDFSSALQLSLGRLPPGIKLDKPRA
ncbi:DUF1643 domain-containing protein [Cryobacterium sp. TMT2-42-4]|nr:DUF1643 domain-containing protein [Cryobacterium sp. TMT2-42-4]